MVNIFGITHSKPILPPYPCPNLTNLVVDVLTPEIRDEITVKDCVIFGKKRSGKTYLEKSLAEKIVEHYGEENVNVYMSDSFSAMVENIDKPTAKCPNCGEWRLFVNNKCSRCEYKMKNSHLADKKVNVLIIDDPLKRYLSRGGTTREQRRAIGEFEAIAHELENRVATRKGVTIIIIGSQQYKGLEKTFRDAPIQIFKTEMGEDQDIVDKRLMYRPKKGRIVVSSTKNAPYNRLRSITDDIDVKNKPEARNTSIVRVGERIGYCVFPPYKIDYSVWVDLPKPDFTVQQKQKYKQITQYAEECRESGIKSTKLDVIKGFLTAKHPGQIDEVRKLSPAVRERLCYDDAVKRATEPTFYSADEIEATEFEWDYWAERDKLYSILSSSNHTNPECLLRAYELYSLGSTTIDGKIARSQEDVANALVEEKLTDRCSQIQVSRWNKKVNGEIATLKGLKYETYVGKRYKQDENVKRVLHLGEVKTGLSTGNYPDLIVLYQNGDIDIVSCKCFNDVVYTMRVNHRNSDVKPELNTFLQLHRGEEIDLPNGWVLRKGKNKVRLVFMLKSTHKQLPKEAYKIYEDPANLPKTLTFSERALKQGTLRSI